MPHIQFTPEELALNAAALTLRAHAEQHLQPKTMGWVDAYATDGTRHGQPGVFLKPLAQQLTSLPDFLALASKHAQTAWTTGLLGSRAIATEGPDEFPFAGPESWQDRLARQAADKLPEHTPTLGQLQQAWAALDVQPMLAGERGLLAKLGIDAGQRVNITNALNGKRASLPAAVRVQLGAWLLRRPAKP